MSSQPVNDMVSAVCAELAERWREPEIAFQVCVDALSRIFAVARSTKMAKNLGKGEPAERESVEAALRLLDDALATWSRHNDPAWEGPRLVALAYRDELRRQFQTTKF